MIEIKYFDEARSLDISFLAAIAEHSPLNPTVDFAAATTGGVNSPDEITFKGSDTVVTVVFKVLRTVDHWATYKAWLDATEKREPFDVNAKTIPLVDVDYVGYRTEKTRIVRSLYSNRFFQISSQIKIQRIY